MISSNADFIAASLADKETPELNVFDSRYKGHPGWTEKNELGYSGYFHTIQDNVCGILAGKPSL